MKLIKILLLIAVILLVSTLFAGTTSIAAEAQTDAKEFGYNAAYTSDATYANATSNSNDVNVTITSPVILQNPWVQKSNVYEGALHSHSYFSDGTASPEAMSQAYRAQGFNFTVLTDHNRLTRYPPAAGILAIPGEEVTAYISDPPPPNSAGMHVGAIGISQAVGGIVIQHVINNITQQGRLADLNHPTLPPLEYSDATLSTLTNYSLISLRSGTGEQPSDAQGPVQLWDSLLTAGKVVWGERPDDAHSIEQVNSSGAVIVNANSLTAAEIIANLRSGNFYSATTCRKPISARISSITTADSTITISVPQTSTIKWIAKGGAVAQTTANVMTDSYTVKGDEAYVRIEVSHSSDASVKAWSQPIFVGIPTATTLTSSNSTPAVNQKATFTATLKNGTTPISGKSVEIYHFSPGGVKYTDKIADTVNGQINVATSWDSTGTRPYYATFAGDGTRVSSTSTVLNVNVKT